MRLHPRLLLFALLANPLLGQEVGIGSPSSNGNIPELILGTPKAQTESFEVRALPPGTVFLLALGTNPLKTPMGQGVFGIDPRTLLLLGPFIANAQGSRRIDLPFPSALEGTLFHSQVLAFDPKAKSFPIPVLSPSKMGLAGIAPPYLVGAFSTPVRGEVDLGLISGSGSLHRLLALTRGITPLPLKIYPLSEERRYRSDLPKALSTLGVSTIRLGDGSVLLHAKSRPSRRAMLLQIHRDGRVSLLLEAPLDPQGLSPFDPTIAASRFGSYLAVLDTRAGKLHLLRTDGTNRGQAHALPTGFAPAGSALFFGKRVLVALMKTHPPILFPLDGSPPRTPKFPSPLPKFFDEECAVSGDGTTFALGAGPGKKIKEIFVLRENGNLKQITHKATDYAEAGYSNLDHRRELVLNQDGSKVAYVEVGRKRTELFLADTNLNTIVHMTPNQVFADSIDIGTIARAPQNGGYLILAGKDALHLDLFHSKKGSPLDVLPLTRSEPRTTPPWGLGAKLRFLDLGSLKTSTLIPIRTLSSGAIVEDFWVVDPLTRKAAKLKNTMGPLARFQEKTSFFCLPNGGGSSLLFFQGKDLFPGGKGAQAVALPKASSLLELLPQAEGKGFLILLSSPTGLSVHDLLPGRTQPLQTLVRLGSAMSFAPNLRKGELFFLRTPTRTGKVLYRWTSRQGLKATKTQGLEDLVRR